MQAPDHTCDALLALGTDEAARMLASVSHAASIVSPAEILAIRAAYGLQCSTESQTVWASAVVYFAAQFRDA